MLSHHEVVIHLVDVIAGEDEHILGLLATDGIDVLVHRICSAHIPVLADTLHRWQDLNKLAQFAGHNRAPAFTDVAVERERLILRKNVDLAQVGVDAVRERDVDDAIVPAEGHSGFGPISCERE